MIEHYLTLLKSNIDQLYVEKLHFVNQPQWPEYWSELTPPIILKPPSPEAADKRGGIVAAKALG